MTIPLSAHKEAFLSEARGYVQVMNEALLKLEKAPENPKFLHEIFWATHTFKGIAASMNYSETERLLHAMEDVLDAIKKRRLPLEQCADLLFESFDFLGASLQAISEDQPEPATRPLVQRLQGLLTSEGKGQKAEGEEKPETSTALEKIRTVEIKVERLDLMMNVAEELLIAKMRLDRLREALDNPELSAAVEMLGRLVTEMQYHVMQARLIPIGFAFNRFPRMVRDLAKEQGKQVDLILEGSEIELDRTVMDEIGESLVHLIRNAVDHGLETTEDRKKAGKSPVGALRLSAKRTNEFVVIGVADDGRGLDLEAIKQTASRRGALAPGATQEEIVYSIFSGISTSAKVTTVSGRGLGLEVVKKRIESIGGSVKVKSTPGHGTTFLIEIPLTLAVIQTLFVEVGGKTYAIPVTHIDRLVTVNREDMKGMLNYEAIVMDQEDVPVTRLDTLFGLETPPLPRQPIVVVRKGEERLGLAVDKLLSTQEIVVKVLNRVVRENRYFSGAALVGSGEAILILDVAHLILSHREIRSPQSTLEVPSK